jgi:hypothetical protein
LGSPVWPRADLVGAGFASRRLFRLAWPGAGAYFSVMKSPLWFAFFLLACLGGPCLAGDAEKQDIDDRFARVNSAVEGLMASNAALQKRLDQLSAELQSVREEHRQSATNVAVQVEIQRLVAALREVDQKRESDKQLILGQLQKIAKTVEEQGSSRAPAPTPPPPKAVASTKEDAYEYTVKSGNRLLDVIKEYNVELKKNHMKPVTLKEVLEANPGLKPNLLIEGKKILIPARPAE